ncbi:MAG: hypothetical protein ACR2PX_18790 [Endozoicomonas sp.]|uniref:hypothetical protein n=1 Tax=Endozoicomonas sp. TaxID=1892382 RepID=UPI003D9AD968
MTDKKSTRPPEGTPEFKEWLVEQSSKHIKDIFGDNHKPADFEESGAIFGNIENLDKTDAELFPDELEEHTPEERRRKFKVHSDKAKKK